MLNHFLLILDAINGGLVGSLLHVPHARQYSGTVPEHPINILKASSRGLAECEYITWTTEIDILTSGYRKYTDSGIQNPMHV